MYKALSYEKNAAGVSVKLRRSQDRKIYWFDLWQDGDVVCGDWNQYIFFLTDADDVHRQKVQDNPEEFGGAKSESIGYLEILGIIDSDNHLILVDEKDGENDRFGGDGRD